MQRLTTLITTLGLLGAVACSPSSKNEQQYWDRNQQKLTEQSTAYPGFAKILATHKTEAEAIMKEAVALKDEDAKAEKMKAANTSISRVLGKMTEIKSKSKSLESKIDDLNRLKLVKSKQARRSEATADARATLREVKRKLTEAAPANEAEALSILKNEVSNLISAQGALRRTYDSLKPKKAKKKRKSKKRRKK